VTTDAPPPLLAAEQLSKHFPVGNKGFFSRSQAAVRAVSNVSLHIMRGETVGLVGESGCGKSTLARLLTLLFPPDEGRIMLAGEDVTALPPPAKKAFHKRVQKVFQDPFSSLNPRLPLYAILSEPLTVHRIGNYSERRDRCAQLLQDVGLDPKLLDRYPHEFSGGQRQRIAIARALALDPELIIADEAVSALDVSVQSQILNLLLELKTRHQLAYLFISHDLAVVDHIADRVAVMYLGRVVESAPRDELFRAPAHPYTRDLMTAIPSIQRGGKRRSGIAIGDVPSALNPPPGCPYHPRCSKAQALCQEQLPTLQVLPNRPANHLAACHFPEESGL